MCAPHTTPFACTDLRGRSPHRSPLQDHSFGVVNLARTHGTDQHLPDPQSQMEWDPSRCIIPNLQGSSNVLSQASSAKRASARIAVWANIQKRIKSIRMEKKRVTFVLHDCNMYRACMCE
ncbi:hypothetical protein AX14_012690 [Amanita brunnescens Koide BX004]|nr:hypothetical protein AX14_012690 [Amanita brunnescens Koide BX004]